MGATNKPFKNLKLEQNEEPNFSSGPIFCLFFPLVLSFLCYFHFLFVLLSSPLRVGALFLFKLLFFFLFTLFLHCCFPLLFMLLLSFPFHIVVLKFTLFFSSPLCVATLVIILLFVLILLIWIYGCPKVHIMY